MSQVRNRLEGLIYMYTLISLEFGTDDRTRYINERVAGIKIFKMSLAEVI